MTTITEVQGEAPWTWSTYAAKLDTIASYYEGYPLGLHIEPQWWTVQLDRSRFTYTTYSEPIDRAEQTIPSATSYGAAFDVDGDVDQEVFQVAWKFDRPDSGYFVFADFAGGVLESLTKLPISGASNVWQLRNDNTGVPLILLTGLDEGKLQQGGGGHAVAETLIFDPVTRSLVGTGIFTSSHESTVVDLDRDGDEDVVMLNWSGPQNASILFVRNDGTTVTAITLPGTENFWGNAIAVTDLEGDGEWEIIAADVDHNWSTDVEPERNQVFSLNADLSLRFKYELPLPYFERDDFDGIVSPFIGGGGRSHDVTIVAEDIDKDGDMDAVMSSMLWSSGAGGDQDMHVFQILVNHDGVLVDETDQRLFNLIFPRGGTHNFELRDVNGDGFADIVAHNFGPALFQHPEVDGALTHGNELYVNDGTGHFVSALGYQLGNPNWQIYTFSEFGDLPRWSKITEWDYGFGVFREVTVAQYAHALSTGPALADPALEGVPGFNEFYYLLHNDDAANAVASGAFATGLDHYLAVGRAQGRFAFAPHALVQGSSSQDTIVLREGNERAFGRGGDDAINGGAGNDSLDGGSGNDSLNGGSGNDSLDGGAGNDILNGGTGNDTLNGGLGTDRMSGGAGDDLYIVNNSTDVVIENANAGTDHVMAGGASYTLGANVEHLTLTGSARDGTGNNLNNVITGNSAVNTLAGGSGNDSLDGGSGNDILDGGTGNDTLNGGLGTDRMSGGAGNDLYIVNNSTDVVIENADEGTDRVQSGGTRYTLGANVEHLTLIGSARDGTGNNLDNVITGNSLINTLVGGSGNDSLDGGAGNDILNGGAGNDTLNGGLGTDRMSGGAGDDLYIANNSTDVVIENANAGTDHVMAGGASYTLGANVEHLTLTGSARDGTGNNLDNVITGNSLANRLTGGSGNDTLSGGPGNDTLDGGLGTDQMAGGAGNDLYIANNSTDVVIENANAGTDHVMAGGASYTLGANVEHLTLTGSARDGTGNNLDNVITGNSLANRLTGGSGNDTLSGGLGNDTLDGGLGTDRMAGGAGNDLYIANNSTDVVIENANEGTDHVMAGGTRYTLGANVEHLTLTGSARDGTGNDLNNVITGNSLINTLAGGSGNDSLDGGSGNDILDGGTGNDTLNGGLGTDRMSGGAGNDLYIVPDRKPKFSLCVPLSARVLRGFCRHED